MTSVPTTTPESVEAAIEFMTSIGFQVTYNPPIRIPDLGYAPLEKDNYDIKLNSTDGNHNLSSIIMRLPDPDDLTPPLFTAWASDLRQDFHALLPKRLNWDAQEDTLELFKAFNNLLVEAGYQAAHTADTIAIWYNCRWSLPMLVFQNTDNANHALRRFANLAKYTNLTVTQRIACAQRDVPTSMLDTMTTSHIPYTLIEEMYPKVERKYLFELPETPGVYDDDQEELTV